MTDDTPELTERQKEYLSHLPASKPDIAESMGVATTTVENYQRAIQNKGIAVDYDKDANQWYLADDRAPKLRRISTKHKAAKTREANEVIEAEESLLLRRLERSNPLPPAPDHTGDGEAFVAILGDLHFGDVVETDTGDVIYDMDTATAAVHEFARKCRHIRNLESEYTTFDACHLILLGDLATGTHIYSGQVHDIEAFLADQVTAATQALLDLVETLADEFDTVQVHGVLGNHGLDRAGAARGSNTDLIVYRWLDDSLRRLDVSNVHLNIAESTHHLNTTIKDWRVHIRHGQDGQRHVDKTAASSRDWRGWLNKHRFQIAVRGHWHDPGLDWILNQHPVISCPSPKPGGEWIDRMGHPDVSNRRHLGWCVGVSEDRRLTFKRLIDDA